jgi:drug/metabolite transporter (DMT)-like permease
MMWRCILAWFLLSNRKEEAPRWKRGWGLVVFAIFSLFLGMLLYMYMGTPPDGVDSEGIELETGSAMKAAPVFSLTRE